MNKVILQIWEESERGFGSRLDGCSIHLDSNERNNYINMIYTNRESNTIPDEYDRIVGDGIEVFIEDSLFNIIKKDKSVRITEYQMNNLISLDDITIKDI